LSELPRYPQYPLPPLSPSAEINYPPERTSKRLPLLLFFASWLTTTLAGVIWYIGYLGVVHVDFRDFLSSFLSPRYLIGGLAFSAAILTILLAHELGHYLTCRKYRIRATLPHFIPVPPLLFPFGTFGAVIKIKSLFENTRQLFDVGIAGPLAGFAFIVPALAIGMAYSREFLVGPETSGFFEFGEPLLLRLTGLLLLPDSNVSITLHPVGWAAWFGMLATSLNLLPVGQLDGGHIVYALFGPRVHRIVSFAVLGGLVVLTLVTKWYGYLLFGTLIFLLGFRHPPTLNDYMPLGAKRLMLALLALAVLVLTFMPVPVRLVTDIRSL
jgi:membrane-associated protease RseP (regulator of RpoE activity)